MDLKKISRVLVAVMTICALSSPVYAVNTGIGGLEIIDGSVIINKNNSNNGSTTLVPKNDLVQVAREKGSISIKLEDTEDKSSKSNVKFAMTKVADIEDGEYHLTDIFKATNIDLNNIKTSNELELVAQKLTKIASPDHELVTDKDGYCNINDLDVGVYLFYPEDTSKYDQITPFIISIPTYSDSDKMMLYDINVIPKHEPYPDEETKNPKAPNTSTENHAYVDMAISGGALLMVYVIYKIKQSSTKKHS